MLKPLLAAVVGVGHFAGLMAAAVAGERHDAVVAAATGVQGPHVGQIAVIHGDDPVEAAQVFGLDLTGAAGQVDAAAFGRGAHAGVGALAHMPVAGASGIHLKGIAEVFTLQQIEKHPLGGR